MSGGRSRVSPPPARRSAASRTAAWALAAAAALSCGRKGPPLPPLIRLPAAPEAVSAERRGDTVAIGLTVPSANTDGTRPADIQRVDVFARSGFGPLPADQVLEGGTRVASLDVKAPRDPEETVEPDEPIGDVPEPEGAGLDQGAVGRMTEALTPAAASAAGGGPGPPGADPCAPASMPARSYVSVGVSTRGRLGRPSAVVSVPLIEPPPRPATPTLVYDESAVTLTWAEPAAAADAARSQGEQLAASGAGAPPAEATAGCPSATAYHVYELTPAAERPAEGDSEKERADRGRGTGAAAAKALVRLTPEPIGEPLFADKRIVWGVERCYTVGAVRVLGDRRIESAPAEPACVTLRDTFPPPAPTGLQSVASDGAINLMWEPSAAADVQGFIVLRARTAGGPFEAVTPEPIAATGYRDAVESGVRFTYAVQAVDRAGNVGDRSAPIEDVAR